jgi:hypothetical protein
VGDSAVKHIFWALRKAGQNRAFAVQASASLTFHFGNLRTSLTLQQFDLNQWAPGENRQFSLYGE